MPMLPAAGAPGAGSVAADALVAGTRAPATSASASRSRRTTAFLLLADGRGDGAFVITGERVAREVHRQRRVPVGTVVANHIVSCNDRLAVAADIGLCAAGCRDIPRPGLSCGSGVVVDGGSGDGRTVDDRDSVTVDLDEAAGLSCYGPVGLGTEEVGHGGGAQ